MPDNRPEQNDGQNNQGREPRQTNEERVRQEIDSKSADEVKTLIREHTQVVDSRQLSRDLKGRIRTAINKDGYPPQSFGGNKDDINDAKWKALYVQKVVHEILRASAMDKTPMADNLPAGATEFGVKVLKTISGNLPLEIVTENSSPFLYDLFTSVLTGSIDSVESLKKEVIDVVVLRQFDPHIFNVLAGSLYQIAAEQGLDPEQIKEEVESTGRKFSRDQVEQNLKHEWDRSLHIFFGGDPKDFETLLAISSTEFFYDYVKKIRSEIPLVEKGPHETDENFVRRRNIEVSNQIRINIGSMISKLFNSIDKSHKSIFFDEAMQKGFPTSLETIYSDIRRKLSALELSIQRETIENTEYAELSKIFHLPTSVSKFVYQYKGDPGHEKMLGSQVIVPSAGNSEVNAQQFVLGILHFVDNEREARSYFHNLQVLFEQPAGKDGFFSQLASYAEKFKAIDMDAIHLLPDSELIMAAIRLYRRHLEEEFTKWDWKHQPGMFTPDFYINQSEVQKAVFEDLKTLVKGMNLEGLKTADQIKLNDWRLQRAMTFAMGMSKGIDMSEPELAAWADPSLSEDGRPTYFSFYTNDAGALDVLNPAFSLMRFQAEGMTLGPLAWTLVYGAMDKKYDHTELFKKIKEYRDSFQGGQAALNRMDPEEVRAFEGFVNLFKVGSPYTRAGWRYTGAQKGWLINKEDKPGELDGFKSFKAFEYIGTQFLISYMNSNEMKTTLKDPVAKKQLFDHLFETYIKGKTEATTSDEYLKIMLKEYVDHKKRRYAILKTKKEFDRHEAEHEAQGKLDKIFLNNALAHMVAKRNPTKFLRIERDRLTLHGERGWTALRKKLYGSLGEVESVSQIDRMMKNIMIVEERMRTDTSIAMRQHLALQGDDKAKRLDTFTPEPNKDYVVDADTIKKVLTENGLDSGEIENTVKFYNEMMSFYKEKNYIVDFGQKLDDDAFPFAISNDDTDFTFIAHRGAGPRLLARALGDTASTEAGSYAGLKEFMGTLPKVALDLQKKDYSPIIHAIEKAKHTVEQVHGLERADKVSQYLAQMAITFFKEDTKAENWWTKGGTIGKPSSIAAEFAGGSLRVWEWDTETVFNFIRDLETHKILPSAKFAHELSNPAFGHDHAHGQPQIVDKKNWRGKVIGQEVVRWKPYEYKEEAYTNIWGNEKKRRVKVENELPEYCSNKLREFTHSKHTDIAKKYLHTYGPAFLGVLAFYYLRQAIKEEEKGGGH